MSLPTTAFVIVPALLPGATAQGDLPLDQVYHFGGISARFFDTCVPGDDVIVLSASNDGTMSFSPTGSLVVSQTELRICADLGFELETFSESFAYSHAIDGSVFFGSAPKSPGSSQAVFQISSDQEVLLGQIVDTSEPRFLLGLRAGTGLSNADLSGEYAVATLFQAQNPDQSETGVTGSLETDVGFGSVTFDGSSFTSFQNVRNLGAFGSLTRTRSTTGTYSVASDGRVTLSSDEDQSIGAISPDGRIGFVVTFVHSKEEIAPGEFGFDEVGMSIFVRKGTTPPTPDALEGDWFLGEYGGRLSGQFAPLTSTQQESEIGVMSFQAAVAFENSFTLSGSAASVGPTGGGSAPSGGFGSIQVMPNGNGSVALNSFGEPPANGWLADTDGIEDLVLFAQINSNAFANFGLLLRDRGPLHTPTEALSVSDGGSQILNLDAGSSTAGLVYFILGSVSGVDAGIPLGNLTLPLNFDGYTVITLGTSGPLLNSNFGTLDLLGSATASFKLVPGSAPSLAGLSVYHAAMLLNFSSLDPVVDVTNPVAVELEP